MEELIRALSLLNLVPFVTILLLAYTVASKTAPGTKAAALCLLTGAFYYYNTLDALQIGIMQLRAIHILNHTNFLAYVALGFAAFYAARPIGNWLKRTKLWKIGTKRSLKV
jgi:hypothetical protein